MSNYNLKLGLLTLTSSEVKGVGPSFIRKHVTSEEYFSTNLIIEIKSLLINNKKEISENIIFQETENAKKIISQCNTENIKILTIFDKEYPSNLKLIKDAPSIIFVKGNIDILNNNTICIIGTREPNENGTKITQRVAEHYKQLKWNICNGLAEGIDTAAIQQNDNYYSNVIGVVAGGLNFNAKKTLLKNTCVNVEKVIDAGGVIISEFPPNKMEDTFSVIKSCRLQAGVSEGLFLIQSSIDGGSKYTLKSYCETNRPLAVINPLKEDEVLPSYSANITIRDNQLIGLSKITGLKIDKISTKNIVLIKSKEDYGLFDKVIVQKNINNQVNKTLFD